METFIYVLSIVFSILSIILFFKIWSMTNDVKAIKNLMLLQSSKANRFIMSLKVNEIYKFRFGNMYFLGFNSDQNCWTFKPVNAEVKAKVKDMEGFNKNNGFLKLTKEQIEEFI